VRLQITALVILLISFKSRATQLPGDTVVQPKFILKVTEAVTKKCHLADSASEKLYTILKETILLYGKCRRESTAYIQICRNIVKEMENEILQKFGKDVYDVYYRFAHPGPCFPRYDPNIRKTGRKMII
jgi:hypothetical protein